MERNVTLDFVRGVAILGILLLNISAFGLPKAAYLNPAWYGAITPQDAWTWAFLDLIGQVKVTHSTLNKRYDEEIANNTTRSHAWKCSKSTAVLKAGSNAGDTTPVP